MMTREEALQLALDWAEGRRSYTNMVHAESHERQLEVVAVMDAQEVVKWAALAAALPVGESGDAYVIVRGGLVVNEPALPVLDLDCLEDRYPTAGTYEEVAERLGRARELGLSDVADECDEWLAVHPTLRPEA